MLLERLAITLFTSCTVLVASVSLAGADTMAGKEPTQLRPGFLYLKAATVDLRNKPTLLREDAVFEPNKHYVMQLDGAITPQRRAMLETVGVQLRDYLPLHAYVVDLSRSRADVLARLDFIRWIGPYEDAWKVSPKPAERRQFQTTSRRQLATVGKRRLTLHLFDAGRAAAVKGKLQTKGVSVLASNATAPSRRADFSTAKRSLLLEADDLRAAMLPSLADVMFIEEAPEGVPRNSTTTWICQSNVPDWTPLWDAGLHGENQIAGLIDWDLDEDHCAFDDIVPIGPSHRKLLAYYGRVAEPNYGWHGTHTGGILAGNELAGTQPDLKGMAYESRIVFQDYAGVIEATNLHSRLQIAHNDGVRVHSNSWGSYSDNSYNAWSRDVDLFSRNYEDDIVIFAIANGSPPLQVLSPENAKNCLAIGATGDTPFQDSHGSGRIGPTQDGRQKPDVWATGCSVRSALENSGCGTASRSCATSWAAPAASGMAVLVRQYFVDGFHPSGTPAPEDAIVPTGALMRAVMINSAVDMDDAAFEGYFGYHEGWGRILVDDALYFPGDTRRLLFQDVRNSGGLSTGLVDRYYVTVNSSDEPLKITVVWTDVPASLATRYTPVNNIDLVVTDPFGTVYRANVFSDTQSIPGGEADTLNNTEQVFRLAPLPGDWKIEVVGTAVNVDLQGYALVVTGDVPSVFSPCLEADLDEDSDIDGDDYLIFLAAFGSSQGDPEYNSDADFDGDGLVSLVDYQSWLACYRDFVGNPAAAPPAPAVPGDINADGKADGRDIQAFVDVVMRPGEATTATHLRADLNGDGEVNAEDAAIFIEGLVGQE